MPDFAWSGERQVGSTSPSSLRKRAGFRLAALFDGSRCVSLHSFDLLWQSSSAVFFTVFVALLKKSVKHWKHFFVELHFY